MPSSHFSRPVTIQQPPPVCKKGPPNPPELPPGGPTLWVEAEWHGLDQVGTWRDFHTLCALTPDLPAYDFDGTTTTTDGWNFHCHLTQTIDDQWQAHVAWSPVGPPNTAAGDGPITMNINPPIQTSITALSSTTPTDQYCTVRFYNP